MKALDRNHLLFQFRKTFVALLIAFFATTIAPAFAAGEDLPSWNDGPVKESIVKFVNAITDENGPDFVKPSERIAVFDNDGTLWCEQPIYPQVVFVSHCAKVYAKSHPEVQDNPLFRAAIEGDMAKLSAAGAKGTQEMVNMTHRGMTTEEFAEVVKKWIGQEKHPRYHEPFTKCVYQPMLEVIAYLKKNGFKNYIVSGGGLEFMRPWTENVYDIPPEHVIGSTCRLQYVVENDKPAIDRLLDIDFICDRERKPVAIEKVIGRRPIAAFGNSNGDLQMLQWTFAGKGKRLAALVHHTDAEREYAYDRNSKVGRLDQALDEASKEGWTVIDMKKDWNKVFQFQ